MSQRNRTLLLAGLGVLLVGGLLFWWLSAAEEKIPDTINGFSTKEPFKASLPKNPKTGQALPAPPTPARLVQALRAKGLPGPPPIPDPNYLPPLPEDAAPILPPPAIVRMGKNGRPERVEVYKDAPPKR